MLTYQSFHHGASPQEWDLNQFWVMNFELWIERLPQNSYLKIHNSLSYVESASGVLSVLTGNTGGLI